MRRLLALLLLLAEVPAGAAELLRGDVALEGEAYTLDFDLRIDAPAAQVLPLLQDYRRYPALNHSVKESRLLADAAGVKRISTTTHACVLFFCKELVQVQEIREEGAGALMGRIVPELSSFKAGWVRWRVDDGRNEVRLHFAASLTPDFWIPPLVGPWAVKRKLRAEALETIANLERLAQGGR